MIFYLNKVLTVTEDLINLVDKLCETMCETINKLVN